MNTLNQYIFYSLWLLTVSYYTTVNPLLVAIAISSSVSNALVSGCSVIVNGFVYPAAALSKAFSNKYRTDSLVNLGL